MGSETECNGMEVATMKLNTIQRPSLLPAAVCAPSALLPVPRTAEAPTPAPRKHQVQIQAELAQVLASTDGKYGINGFEGSNGVSVSAWMTDGGSGAPPRGRPV
jgi:hypothetical protein